MLDGSIERKKARLVARGFSQVEGIDFEENCSSVIKFLIIRIIVTLAIHQEWDQQQLDVNNAFLNIECKESVYMSQLLGFARPYFPHKVCQLNKSLYGLRQSPRAWYEKLHNFLNFVGFRTSSSYSSLFCF